MNTLSMQRTLPLMLACLVAGCDSPQTGKSADVVSKVEVVTEQPATGETGVVIDPGMKTLTIVNDKGRAKQLNEQISRLNAENVATQAQLSGRIAEYSDNIHDPAMKESVATEMVADLETYKRQTLDLYKKQQELASQPPAGQ